MLIAKAMQLDLDWLLMIDSDTWGKGADLLRMILAANEQGATIVAAPVSRRQLTSSPQFLNVYRQVNRQVKNYFESYDRLDLEALPALFGVHAAGAALMAVNLRKIGEATFKFTDTLSEDLEFCRQIREAGGKILVDKRVETGHLSKPDFMRYEP
jgi:GT2 family glycosyltransferase